MKNNPMIDGIMCSISGDSIENILDNSVLEFVEKRGELEAKYKGMIITFVKKNHKCFIRGSIHKFKNEGLHNADLFTYQDFYVVVSKLVTELKIAIEDLDIIRFEIGVNIPLSRPTHEYLNCISEVNNLIPTVKNKKKVLLKYIQYNVKIYSKSNICEEFKNENIIRVEIAYKKKQKITQDIWKLYTLKDLLDVNMWTKISNILEKLIRNITFFDFSEMKNAKFQNKEERVFYEWSNPVRIAQETDRSKACKMRKRVNEIYHTYAKNTKANELVNTAKFRLKQSLNF